MEVVVRYELRCLGRVSALSGVVLATWLLSALLAWIADHYGIF